MSSPDSPASPPLKISYRGRNDRALVAEVSAVIIASRTTEQGVVSILDGRHSDMQRLFVGIVRTLRGEGTGMGEVIALVLQAYQHDDQVTEYDLPVEPG